MEHPAAAKLSTISHITFAAGVPDCIWCSIITLSEAEGVVEGSRRSKSLRVVQVG